MAASLAAVEGLVILLLAVLEVVNLSSERLTMGLTTTAFFAAYGLGLLVCAAGLQRRHSWGRSPVILAQLIQLGLAWSFRGGETTLIGITLALVAVVVVAGILHPASVLALSDDPRLDDADALDPGDA